MRALVRQTLVSAPVRGVVGSLFRDHVTILTLHRFRREKDTSRAHDVHYLRRALDRLRSDRCAFVSIEEALGVLTGRTEATTRMVALTVDDGYADFKELGAPLFAEFDCPVTMFLTTDFASGRMWYWWDKIDYVMSTTRRRSFELPIDGRSLRFAPAERDSTEASVQWLREHLQTYPQSRVDHTVEQLARLADVELPERPPERFRGLDWEEVRALERDGVRFGPHSVTHPVLTFLSDDELAREVAGSWLELRARLRAPVPVFAYPNGRFGAREVTTSQAVGLDGALSTKPGYARCSEVRRSSDARYRLPRFGCPDRLESLRLLVQGFERIADPVQRFLRWMPPEVEA